LSIGGFHTGLLLFFGDRSGITAIAHAIIEASFDSGHTGHQILGIGIFTCQLISNISDAFAQWLRVNTMFLVVSLLDLTTTVSLVDGVLHGFGDFIRIHVYLAGHIRAARPMV